MHARFLKRCLTRKLSKLTTELTIVGQVSLLPNSLFGPKITYVLYIFRIDEVLYFYLKLVSDC